MIPHHQVAVDMSHLLQATKLTNPTILHLCRNIIRKQNYEIWEMTMMKQQPSASVFRTEAGVVERATTKMEVYDPFVGKAYCNPLFFDPDAHHKQMQHHAITIKSYLEHMIPHHQVAVDMSKRLLLHTNHSYLMDFCRKLILDQQYEISVMKNLLMYDSYKHDESMLM
jgi:uncharacterized protein (DUF305 family)